tara:strand:+ start:1246 stop:1545 length:300 start_codon:yes stop_codon:yes gene_type:complete
MQHFIVFTLLILILFIIYNNLNKSSEEKSKKIIAETMVGDFIKNETDSTVKLAKDLFEVPKFVMSMGYFTVIHATSATYNAFKTKIKSTLSGVTPKDKK